MDAIEFLTSDHRTVKGLFRRFAHSSRPETCRSTAEEIIREVSLLAAIEAEKLYPAVRDEVPGGRPLYEESLDEHRRVNKILAQLEGSIRTAHTERFGAKIGRLKRGVEEHMREVETEILPRLRDAVSKTRLIELGHQLEHAKAVSAQVVLTS